MEDDAATVILHHKCGGGGTPKCFRGDGGGNPTIRDFNPALTHRQPDTGNRGRKQAQDRDQRAHGPAKLQPFHLADANSVQHAAQNKEAANEVWLVAQKPL